MSAFVLFLIVMVGVPFGLIFCTVVARDMDSRGLDGRLYGALTLLLPPVGLALWVYKRATTPKTDDETTRT
ncbi:MAG TPA: hypothetical protein VGP53_06855 [Acidimicrobiales bacterium]|nr:hypothetical protein [Acidimicrobiales bacterium]